MAGSPDRHTPIAAYLHESQGERVTGSALVALETLEELAEQIGREHAETLASLGGAIKHALTCGELLLKARERFDNSGGWTEWLTQDVQISPNAASRYMRLAFYREQIPLELLDGYIDAAGRHQSASISRLAAYVRGLPAIRHGSTPGSFRSHIPDEVKAEAKRLHKEGMSYTAIGELLSVNKSTIAAWCDPETRRRQRRAGIAARARRRQAAKALRDVNRREAARLAAQDASAALSRLYADAEKMQDTIGLAEREATSPDAVAALRLAGQHYRKMRDAIVQALGVE